MQRTFIKAQVRFIGPSKNGRNLMPIGDGYSPYIRASLLAEDLPVRIYALPEAGDFEVDYHVEVELSYHPRVDYSGLRNGEQFSLVEGVKLVGSGIVESAFFVKEVGVKLGG